MISIISPAKKIRENIDVQIDGENLLVSQPYFSQENDYLADMMQQKTAENLQNIMGISDKLSALNYQRYQDIKDGTAKNLPAIFAFAGDVYQSLNVDSFDKADLNFANQHLAILSGFYGLLHPFDAMAPYRLEMGLALKINDFTNPYQFWRDKITDYLNHLLENHQEKIILNLASQEYSQAVNSTALPQFITVSFRQRRGNQLKNIGLLAKRARGTMARQIIINKIDSPTQVQKICFDNYQFDDTLSSDNHYMFVQTE